MFTLSWRLVSLLAVLIMGIVGCSSDDTPSEAGASATTQRAAATPSSGKGTSESGTAAWTPEALDDRERSMLVEGQRAFQQGNYERALAFLDSVETAEPRAPVVHFNRGRVYTALNRIEAARTSYRRAIELDPQYPEARQRLGDIEYQRGAVQKALALYREEEQIDPTSQLYVNMGLIYTRLGKVDSARMAYDKAVALDSTDANAHMMYGQFLEETGDLEAALTHSRAALSIEPDRPNYQFAVGSQLFQLGRLEDAAEYLRQAADGRLLHYPAQYNMGQVLMRLGREQEADKYLARADSARQLMDQITAAQSVASRDPGSVDNWVELGDLFRKAGERNRAVQAFNRAASLQPTNLRVQNRLGEMMLAEGRTQQALQRFQNILSVDETRAEVWINLGLAHAVAGNCAEARQAWNTALQHRPDDPTARKYLDGLCQYSAQ
jgi:tetratricopeptide (TPR) repeat protein